MDAGYPMGSSLGNDRVEVVVVVVFALNRSFYPTTSAVPPVSFLILHPGDIQIMWSQTETEKKQTLKNQGRQTKC